MLKRWRAYWDSHCQQCGLCCYVKTRTQHQVVYFLDAPCEFLDAGTQLCRVYHARFRENPDCRKMTLWKAMWAAYLPETCGYVQWARRHRIRFARRLPTVYRNGSADFLCPPFWPPRKTGS